jgi:hypothetical protein
MKKRILNTKLYLKKKKIASLNLNSIQGGTEIPTNDPTTVDNSLGKQSTCPIETCTCLDTTDINPVKL